MGQLRAEQPARDVIDRNPCKAIDAQEHHRQDHHHCKEDRRCRCRDTKQATKEYSFKAIVRCADAGTDDCAQDYDAPQLVPVAWKVSNAKFVKD